MPTSTKTRRHILFAFDFTSSQVIADAEKPRDCIIVALGESNSQPMCFIHVIRAIDTRLNTCE